MDNANAVASSGCLGATVMNAHATAVTEHPAAVILVIISMPLETLMTCLPSVTYTAS